MDARIIVLAAVLGVLAMLLIRVVRHHPRFCRHERWTRYWFRAHRYAVVCKFCRRVLAEGRDLTHRYPDDELGVRRGRSVTRYQNPSGAFWKRDRGGRR